jgi:hypothetical protein
MDLQHSSTIDHGRTAICHSSKDGMALHHIDIKQTTICGDKLAMFQVRLSYIWYKMLVLWHVYHCLTLLQLTLVTFLKINSANVQGIKNKDNNYWNLEQLV